MARFCMGCGSALRAPRAPSRASAELRFVTVAFCDISGSTRLALRFDPQVWHGILEAYFAEVGGALVDAGGRLEKFIGDAVVGVFGADATGEDDALRAAEGALDALRRLRTRNETTIGRYGIRLSIRFGIASGRVVLTQRDSSFAIGSVMNRAARLQAAAPADGAVVDARTWLLIRDDLRCEPVDPVPAKGFDRPLRAWQVTGGPAAHDAGSPFVNQTDLLARLRTAVLRATGTPGVSTIALEGEMGSGKTRVLRRLTHELSARRLGTLMISCQRTDADQALWRLHQIDRGLGGRVTGSAGTPSTQELQWRIRRRLAEVSRERPLVVLVDDYPRSPPVLRELIQAPPEDTGPLVFVLTGRDIPHRTGTLTLRVPALTDADALELLCALTGEVELHSAPVDMDGLVRRARGNPLFLEQLAALAADGSDNEVAPSAVVALGARITRLSTPARHVLGCVGAWGREIGPGDLDAVCELDEAALAAALDELEATGLVANQTAAEVAYAHLGLGERARTHTAIAHRLRAYARSEPALLELAAAHATQAQRHWRELDPGSADDAAAVRLAAECLVAAARHAIARSEVRTAALLAAQARDLDGADPALTLEIAALESYALGAGGQVAEALARIDTVAGLTGNPSAQAHLLVNGLALRDGDPAHLDTVARVAGDPGATARLETLHGVYAARRGDYPRAEALLRSAYARMREFGAALGVAEIYGNLSLFLAYGDTPVAEATAECLAMRKEVAAAPILHAVVSCSTALLLHFGGDETAATGMLADARSVFADMGHVLGQAGAYEFSGMVAELSGHLDTAGEFVTAARRLYEGAGATGAAARCAMRAFVLDQARPPPPAYQEGADGWEARTLRHLAAALGAAGTPAARSHLDRAVAEVSAIRGSGVLLLPLTGCLRVAQRLGDTARARDLRATLAGIRRD